MTVTAPVNRAPVAVDDVGVVGSGGSTGESAPGVLGNDSDPDGDQLSAVLVDEPAHGSVTLLPDGGYLYLSTFGFVGVDTFTYRADDGVAQSNLATVSMTVTAPVNRAPVAVDDVGVVGSGGSTGESAPGVLGNDSDPDGDQLSAVLVDEPAHGSVTLLPDGGYLYLSTFGFVGVDTFTYRADDGVAQSNLATVSMTVTAPTGTAPVIAPTAPPAQGSVGTPFTFQFMATGSPAPTFAVAPNGLAALLGVSFVFAPSECMPATTTPGLPPGLELSPSGLLSGTPTATGSFIFSVVASNSAGSATAGPFTITIAPSTGGRLSIVTRALPRATIGVPYWACLVAKGGTPPYHWSVRSRDLPRGLVLDPETGSISGTPTGRGSEFEVKVTDSRSPRPARDREELSIKVTRRDR